MCGHWATDSVAIGTFWWVDIDGSAGCLLRDRGIELGFEVSGIDNIDNMDNVDFDGTGD